MIDNQYILKKKLRKIRDVSLYHKGNKEGCGSPWYLGTHGTQFTFRHTVSGLGDFNKDYPNDNLYNVNGSNTYKPVIGMRRPSLQINKCWFDNHHLPEVTQTPKSFTNQRL